MRGPIAVALACAVLLGGCKVDTTVSVKSDRDGRGRVSVRVRLDAEAVFALQAGGGSLADRVLLDDLAAAGWSVSKWVTEGDGAASVSLTKDFAGEKQLGEVLAEVAGPKGLLRSARIDPSRGIASASDALSIEADLRGLESGLAGDGEVARRLKASGVDVDALDASLTAGLGSAFGLTVTLAVGEKKRVWHLSPGERKSLVVSTSRIEWDRIMTLGITTMLAFLAALLFLAAWMSAHRHGRGGRFGAGRAPTW